MNASKARDFFSAYYEGELNEGIKEAFERALASDATLKSEYDEFCSTMKLLDSPEGEIEIPFDLHEKIMAKLDHQEWETKQNSKVSLWGQWRLAFIGGIAGLALIAGFMSINAKNNSGSSTAGTLSINQPTVKPVVADMTYIDSKLTIKVDGGDKFKLDIIDLRNDEVVGELSSETSNVEFANDHSDSQAFSVNDSKGETKLVFVTPGQSLKKEFSGEGTVLDLAKSLAGTFRTPIIVRAKDLDRTVRWEFAEDSDTASRSTALKDQGLDLSVREDGITILSSFSN